MPKATLDKPVPDSTLHLTGNQTLRLSDLHGQIVVLYFYPKDNTPGCTTEGRDFRDRHAAFRRLKAVVLGISRDSLRSHEAFKARLEFPFDLVSDADEKLCKLFGVIKEKNMYGRKVLGIERSTFVIDRRGVLRHEFRGVRVAGHVDEVLAVVKQLNKS